MSACPFCQTAMQLAPSGELPMESCTDCGAVWFEGEALAKVMGGSISDALLRRAESRPGICKGCQAELRRVPHCTDCGTRAPTCPRCHQAPMPVVEALGVPMEVCADCAGVALDAGELELLEEAVEAYRNEPITTTVRPSVKIQGRPSCTTCQRNLRPEHGFVWEDAFYCGSCAPSGAIPFTNELNREDFIPLFVPTSDGGAALNVGGFASAALRWLFQELKRRGRAGIG
ncbi:zf-TFIIB domain-containing protein [Myxococcus sp. Y35]|uniref:zf-TFIIB domain-containing protein n=1 Tax=Pseudomyxococcus flavus TaxID=3115648 RepID=UPI003CF9F205